MYWYYCIKPSSQNWLTSMVIQYTSQNCNFIILQAHTIIHVDSLISIEYRWYEHQEQYSTMQCTLHLPGRLVPMATRVIAVTSFLSPMLHPRAVAMSPMTAVRSPIKVIEATKQGQPYR